MTEQRRLAGGDGRRQATNVAIGDRGGKPRGYRKSVSSTFQPPAAGTVSLA